MKMFAVRCSSTTYGSKHTGKSMMAKKQFVISRQSNWLRVLNFSAAAIICSLYNHSSIQLQIAIPATHPNSRSIYFASILLNAADA